jgi:hypothetical protein
MLNCPTNTSAAERKLDVDQEHSSAQNGGAWRIGDAPLCWDISLTDRIQAALRQCVSRRLTLGQTVHRQRAA